MVKKVNWVLTLVMSILFGYLGVDRFIMGHIWQGILKLLISVLTLGVLYPNYKHIDAYKFQQYLMLMK